MEQKDSFYMINQMEIIPLNSSVSIYTTPNVHILMTLQKIPMFYERDAWIFFKKRDLLILIEYNFANLCQSSVRILRKRLLQEVYGFNYSVVVNLVCIYIKALTTFTNPLLMHAFFDFFFNDITIFNFYVFKIVQKHQYYNIQRI